MLKIPKKFVPLVAGMLMALMMSWIMSGIVTAINLGIPENFLSLWGNAFVKVAPIAFVAVMVVRPIVEKLVKKIVKER